jgi:hypothetical protein
VSISAPDVIDFRAVFARVLVEPGLNPARLRASHESVDSLRHDENFDDRDWSSGNFRQ